jgi:hypothetical protein
LIDCVNGFCVAQVDAALPASFGDRGTQANFFTKRTRSVKHVLYFDLSDFSHAHACG